VAGAGSVVLDVPGYTLLQALTPREALGRVFGVLESLLVGAVAVGSVLGGLLISELGTRGALVVVGALVPVAVCRRWSRPV
jgi:MFS family permease